MKHLTKHPWRNAFLSVLDRHVGGVLDEYDVPTFDELGAQIDPHWAMTLWDCAFEDFLTMEVEDVGNIVDDYLKRRGWKEIVRNREYISGLKDSTMSLYEVSDIEPGRSFLARDLIHGGKPVQVSEGTASKTIKQWDHLAMRIVHVRGTKLIGGGLLPFATDLSERLIAAIRDTENRTLPYADATTDETTDHLRDSELDGPIGEVTKKRGTTAGSRFSVFVVFPLGHARTRRGS